MRKSFVLLCLVFWCTAIYGQKTRFGELPPKAKPGVDYPIAIHIHGTHIRQNCQYDWQSAIIGGPAHTCPNVVYVDAIFNGKNVELMGAHFDKFSISPGDYQARLTTKAPNADPAVMGQKYELLSPDKRVWRCIVTGISD